MSQSKEWTSNIDVGKLSDQAKKGAKVGLQVALEHILGVSNDRVPIERGMAGGLESTGAVSLDSTDRVRGAVSYDKEYAVRQHEDMSYHHDEGRTAKYLERAFADEADKIGPIIQQGIKRSMGT